jgi:hypothetical protein
MIGMKAIGVGPEALLFSKPIDTPTAAPPGAVRLSLSAQQQKEAVMAKGKRSRLCGKF